MIKIKRIEKPVQLTLDKQKELTEKFKTTKRNVWNKPYIKKQLLKMSNNKCCYCETKISENGKYMEVEHFFPKKLFPDKVVEWSNLLPSCKRCNGKKGELNTKEIRIVNPTIDNPKEHLFIHAYRFYPKTEIGKATRDNLFLNNRNHLLKERIEIGDNLLYLLDKIIEAIKFYKEKKGNSLRNDLTEQFEHLLNQAISTSKYSATCATTILTSPIYQEIKKEFISFKFWNAEFEELEKEMEFCSLIK